MPAAVGNKYAIGNNGGRPRLYNSADEIIEEINDYFEYIKGEYHSEKKEGSDFQERICDRDPEPATITGLALYLGFESRQSLIDYTKSEEFSFAIKRGKLRIEHEYEKRLHQNNPTGAIFGLKNMAWTDRHEITGAEGGDLFKDKADSDLRYVLDQILSKTDGKSSTDPSDNSSQGITDTQGQGTV